MNLYVKFEGKFCNLGQITDLKGKSVIHSECKYKKELTVNN